MTTPYERTRAVLKTRLFLQDLQSARKCPDLPQELRNQASALLRHFPDRMDLIHLYRMIPMFYDDPDSVE
jgi:hypothetical protein